MNTNTYAYMKSSEYEHASLMGFDTGIRYLLFSDIASASGDETLADWFKRRAAESVDAVAHLYNPIHFLSLWFGKEC